MTGGSGGSSGAPAPAPIPAPAPVPAPVAAAPPRAGGGHDSDSWWTGGSNVVPGARPKTILARRPTDFRNAEKIETKCKEGLPDERKLGLTEEANSVITLSAWTKEIKKKVEDCGMDTVFYVYTPGR